MNTGKKDRKKPSHLRLLLPANDLSVIRGGKRSNTERLQEIYQTLKGGAGKYQKSLYIAALSITTAAAAISWMGGKIKETAVKAEKVYSTGDLDGDGIADLVVIQKDGHEVPLYCLSSRKLCVSAEKMKYYYGGYADYEGIEKKLNEH